MKLALLIALCLCSWSRLATAQEASAVVGSQSCEQVAARGAHQTTATATATEPASDELEPPPVQWTEWTLTGKIVPAHAQPLRAAIDGALQARRALPRSARDELAAIIGTMGYQLVHLTTRTTPSGGVLATVEVEPRPLIRKVEVETVVHFTSKFWTPFVTVLLNDEVKRRMRLRTGAFLPWDPAVRACELLREEQRLADYLHDEGFFEGAARLTINLESPSTASVGVKLDLGPEYHLGRVTIDQPGGLTLSEQEIRSKFQHDGTCLLVFCIGTARFTRAQYQSDVKSLIERYQRQGFPAVRVQPRDLDPKTAFDRRTKTVNFTLRIDERRRIDVVFEGHDPDLIKDDKLRSLLTFDEAGSGDDVEVNDSAAALTTYLQGRGYFDARVTWKRERFSNADQVVFRIAMGPQRRVRGVDFTGNHEFTQGELTELIATRPYGRIVRLFGDAPPLTAQQLADDATSIVRAYRRRGYREAKVEVTAGPTLDSLSSVALVTSQISTSLAADSIYVRFVIDEGKPTYLRHLEIHLPGEAADGTLAAEYQTLCDQVLHELAAALNAPSAKLRMEPRRCMAAANVVYREELFESNADKSGATDRIRDLLHREALPQSEVELVNREEGPLHIDLVFHLRQLEKRNLGKVLLLGNFRTRRHVILRELEFTEGLPLTADLSSEGQRRLRATGLFDRVNVSYVDGAYVDGARVSHAVVQVEERDIDRFQGEIEGGVSTLTGSLSLFGKLGLRAPNLWGRGISVDTAGTLGTAQLFGDASIRVPRFLVPRWFPVSFDTALIGLWHRQNTDRFGQLVTKGLTTAFSRSWQRSNTTAHPARALSTGLRYDFRLRDRQVESIRPAGVDSDQSQIPVSTVSGALALTFDWEQRVTRSGILSPLAPEDGYRLQASISFASPYLLGQDTFLKLGGSAQVYWPLGRSVLLRTDLRYDHGIPLTDNVVVLPEVERFFAGGDSTVRGYDEDRLATEIITQPVPPFTGAEQVRVVAAGGNIRAIGSIDAQLVIHDPFATALFLDAGVVTNDWRATSLDDLRPGTGMAVRAVLPFGAVSLEYAIPLRTKIGDDPRGRVHFGFAMRFD